MKLFPGNALFRKGVKLKVPFLENEFKCWMMRYNRVHKSDKKTTTWRIGARIKRLSQKVSVDGRKFKLTPQRWKRKKTYAIAIGIEVVEDRLKLLPALKLILSKMELST